MGGGCFFDPNSITPGQVFLTEAMCSFILMCVGHRAKRLKPIPLAHIGVDTASSASVPVWIPGRRSCLDLSWALYSLASASEP